MKARVTKKAIRENFYNIIRVGYTDLQCLLALEDPHFYISRHEGWAADVYDFGCTAIVTGYDPFGNIRPSHELCREYDERARNTLSNTEPHSYERRKAALLDLIYEFINAALKENKEQKGGKRYGA